MHSFALRTRSPYEYAFHMARVGFIISPTSTNRAFRRPSQVRKKLEPLEKGFWAKALAANGFREHTRRKKDKLLGAQQAELGSLGQTLRRYFSLETTTHVRLHSAMGELVVFVVCYTLDIALTQRSFSRHVSRSRGNTRMDYVVLFRSISTPLTYGRIMSTTCRS